MAAIHEATHGHTDGEADIREVGNRCGFEPDPLGLGSDSLRRAVEYLKAEGLLHGFPLNEFAVAITHAGVKEVGKGYLGQEASPTPSLPITINQNLSIGHMENSTVQHASPGAAQSFTPVASAHPAPKSLWRSIAGFVVGAIGLVTALATILSTWPQ